MTLQLRLLLLAIGLCLHSIVASAEQATATAQISIEVVQGCQLDNGSGGGQFGVLNFGEHSSLQSGIDATTAPGAGAIGFRCTPGLNYRIELDNGLHGTNSSERRLQNPVSGETVLYQVYQDAARSQVWDEQNPRIGSATGELQWLPVFGRISASATTPSPGNYHDTLGVTLIF